MHVSEVAEPATAARSGEPPGAARRLLDSQALPGLLVALLTAAGFAIRLVVAHQPLFADELSTYWIITSHGLGGVLSTVHSNAEITPPLYFVAAWLTSQISHAPELVRAPSLIAGTATIPLVYLLGLRTVGRAAALVAAALTTAAPFMIYYSTEARGYAAMMALTALSTLAMLIAVDSARARWWVVYGVATAGAAYSHYTCVFALGVQLLWLLWAHPQARRPALLANAGAVVLYLPWTTGLVKDFTSPTSKILSALSPFDAHAIRTSLEHWSIGFPYSTAGGLRQLPGTFALVLLAVALVLGAVGVWQRLRGRRLGEALRGIDRRLLLVLLLLLSVPVGEAAVSAVSTHLFSVRNLAASWPALALALGALVTAPRQRLAWAASLLAVAAVAIGGVKMLQSAYSRPDYRAAADFVKSHAGPRDVIIDDTAVLSPGPLSGLDALWPRRPQRVIRAGAPQETDHPFNVYDRVTTAQQAIDQAVAAAHGRRVYYIELFPKLAGKTPLEALTTLSAQAGRFPPGYRLTDTRIYPGMSNVAVQVYASR
jgi:4-amino-4-deoxy-L-arabinose transferase-like glycosyltransferase